MASSFRSAWAQAWRERGLRLQVAITVPALALALAALARFVTWVERRPGVTLADPVLALVEPKDVTWLTFGLVYGGIAVGVAALARRPRELVAAVQGYAVLAAFRIAAMWVTPLDPPPGMIELQDPLVQQLGTGQLLTRDLFFSGHASTMFLLFLAVPGRGAKALLLACTALVSACVLWQHVHYAVDVLVAPFVAYASWRLVRSAGSRREAPAGGG